MAISFNSSNAVNSFFNTSLGVSNNANNNQINSLLSSGSLSEYSTIKSGAYKKLLTAYYAKGGEISATDKTEIMNNQTISNQASNANGALSDLKKMDISEENKTSIQDKIKSFVDSYNDVVDKLVDSDTKSVLQKGVWMTKAVSSYAGVLNKVGIQVGSDNKLTLNIEKFQSASVEQIESVFKGNMSVGSKISYKINQVESIAVSNKIQGYTNKGEKKSSSSVSMFDQYL